MIARYNRWSFVFGVPGVFTFSGALLLVFGTVLLMIGLVYYAKARGQSPAWCIAAFLSIFSLGLLLLLGDKSGSAQGVGGEHEKA
jgi:hypothetical protein